MPIACVDWHGAPADFAALYARELRRWSTELQWDTASSWEQVEAARQSGVLPGFVAFDNRGAVAGWAFYLVHRGILQLGGFTSDSAEATAVLLESIFASDVAARAELMTAFVFTEAPALAELLAERGLEVGAYEYLVKPLDASGSDHRVATSDTTDIAGDLRGWQGGDVPRMARLLALAYPGADATRPFAPRGTLDEWSEYVGQLVNANGCGTVMTEASVAHHHSQRMSGVVLVTALSATTAHIAQLAVDPRVRGRGIARRLVNEACERARRAGCRRVTLLVESRNVPARRLYADAGFTTRAQFVSAGGHLALQVATTGAPLAPFVQA